VQECKSGRVEEWKSAETRRTLRGRDPSTAQPNHLAGSEMGRESWVASVGMTGGEGRSLDRLGVGLGGGGGLWGGRAGLRPGLYMGGLRGRRAGRKAGHYTLSEFGASRRKGNGWVWLGMLGHYGGLRIGGRRRIAVGEVLG
jgi:hypothetical protein